VDAGELPGTETGVETTCLAGAVVGGTTVWLITVVVVLGG
jgi:hypothetical protein